VPLRKRSVLAPPVKVMALACVTLSPDIPPEIVPPVGDGEVPAPEIPTPPRSAMPPLAPPAIVPVLVSVLAAPDWRNRMP
jgi:hypothetical protein